MLTNNEQRATPGGEPWKLSYVHCRVVPTIPCDGSSLVLTGLLVSDVNPRNQANMWHASGDDYQAAGFIHHVEYQRGKGLTSDTTFSDTWKHDGCHLQDT